MLSAQTTFATTRARTGGGMEVLHPNGNWYPTALFWCGNASGAAIGRRLIMCRAHQNIFADNGYVFLAGNRLNPFLIDGLVNVVNAGLDLRIFSVDRDIPFWHTIATERCPTDEILVRAGTGYKRVSGQSTDNLVRGFAAGFNRNIADPYNIKASALYSSDGAEPQPSVSPLDGDSGGLCGRVNGDTIELVGTADDSLQFLYARDWIDKCSTSPGAVAISAIAVQKVGTTVTATVSFDQAGTLAGSTGQLKLKLANGDVYASNNNPTMSSVIFSWGSKHSATFTMTAASADGTLPAGTARCAAGLYTRTADSVASLAVEALAFSYAELVDSNVPLLTNNASSSFPLNFGRRANYTRDTTTALISGVSPAVGSSAGYSSRGRILDLFGDPHDVVPSVLTGSALLTVVRAASALTSGADIGNGKRGLGHPITYGVCHIEYGLFVNASDSTKVLPAYPGFLPTFANTAVTSNLSANMGVKAGESTTCGPVTAPANKTKGRFKYNSLTLNGTTGLGYLLQVGDAGFSPIGLRGTNAPAIFPCTPGAQYHGGVKSQAATDQTFKGEFEWGVAGAAPIVTEILPESLVIAQVGTVRSYTVSRVNAGETHMKVQSLPSGVLLRLADQTPLTEGSFTAFDGSGELEIEVELTQAGTRSIELRTSTTGDEFGNGIVGTLITIRDGARSTGARGRDTRNRACLRTM